MITFVGIIGKNNKPLYLKPFGSSKHSEARLIELTYSSCDIFRERIELEGKCETYFGRLSSYEDLDLYGLQSNTKIKFIVVLEDIQFNLPETVVKSLLTTIHSEYINAGKIFTPLQLGNSSSSP